MKIISKINVNSSISCEDLTREYSEKDLDEIRKENLDLFVNFGASSIKGELLEVSPHGVISLQYGNIDDHKKGPPDFGKFLTKRRLPIFLFNQISKSSIRSARYYLKDQFQQTFSLLSISSSFIKNQIYLFISCWKIFLKINYQKILINLLLKIIS